jgi:hypothetical protein
VSLGIKGLDYFGARYFSGAQGRFTGIVPHVPAHDGDVDARRRCGHSMERGRKCVMRNTSRLDSLVIGTNRIQFGGFLHVPRRELPRYRLVQRVSFLRLGETTLPRPRIRRNWRETAKPHDAAREGMPNALPHDQDGDEEDAWNLRACIDPVWTGRARKQGCCTRRTVK